MFDHDVRFYPFEDPCKCLKLQIWVWCKIRGIVYNSLYSDMIHQKCNRHGDYPVPKAAEHTWLFDLIFTHKPSDVYVIRNDFMNLRLLRSGGQEVISLFVKKVPHSMDFGFLAAKPASLRTDFAHESKPSLHFRWAAAWSHLCAGCQLRLYYYIIYYIYMIIVYNIIQYYKLAHSDFVLHLYCILHKLEFDGIRFWGCRRQ